MNNTNPKHLIANQGRCWGGASGATTPGAIKGGGGINQNLTLTTSDEARERVATRATQGQKRRSRARDHRRAANSWIGVSYRLKNFNRIDKQLLKQIGEEKWRWTAILERMMSIVFFLAGNNLLFRGSSETLYTPNNGNFLGLVKLLGKLDDVDVNEEKV
ncbi:putative zinc finger MYM domain containing 1 [Danaus plexippus plexippus]|uniref:Zinc finger MYM domain containing 1 n=1 Tax=Danaus plexippus plexippus TaxID=278856 RepID=A0A212FBM8_DANPL|nr:putative zinc finger MYM domain containing 1 [Danaus plexippus plexippus]